MKRVQVRLTIPQVYYDDLMFKAGSKEKIPQHIRRLIVKDFHHDKVNRSIQPREKDAFEIIAEAVKVVFGKKPEEYFVLSRLRELCDIRTMFFALLYEYTDMGYERIGRLPAVYRGRKYNHSSILHAVRKHEDLLSTDESYAGTFSTLSALVEKRYTDSWSK